MRAPVARRVVVRIAEVVLHVAVAVDVPGRKVPSNSARIISYGLLKMCASTFRRPRWGMPITISSDAGGRRVLDERIEQRDQRLATLEREPLLPDELRVEELLERLGGDEPLEDAPAVLGVSAGWFPRALHALLEPFAPRLVGECQVLDAERAAVGASERREQLAEGRGPQAAEAAAVHLAVQVALAEAELAEIEERVGRGPRARGSRSATR